MFETLTVAIIDIGGRKSFFAELIIDGWTFQREAWTFAELIADIAAEFGPAIIRAVE